MDLATLPWLKLDSMIVDRRKLRSRLSAGVGSVCRIAGLFAGLFAGLGGGGFRERRCVKAAPAPAFRHRSAARRRSSYEGEEEEEEEEEKAEEEEGAE